MANARRDAEVGAGIGRINDPQAYADGQLDLDRYLPAFAGTRIRATDCDGLVERGGRVVFFEHKRTGTQTPTGQHILFEALSSKPDIVCLVEEVDDDKNTTHLTIYAKGKKGERTPATLLDINKRIRKYLRL